MKKHDKKGVAFKNAVKMKGVSDQMEITVNGRTLSEMAELLCEPFPKEDLKEKDDGTVAIPVGVYEKRLNQVVGIMNYDFICSQAKYEEVCGSYVTHVHARIVIRDDLGEPIVTKCACGGSDVIIVRDTGKPKSLKSELDIAVSEAFKNCCKKLGIGVEQMRMENASRKRRNASSETRQGSKEEAEKVQRVTIIFESSLSTGNGYYHAMVQDKFTGNRIKFLLFKRELEEFERRYNIREFCENCRAGTSLTFDGKITTFKNERQLIFSKW